MAASCTLKPASFCPPSSHCSYMASHPIKKLLMLTYIQIQQFPSKEKRKLLDEASGGTKIECILHTWKELLKPHLQECSIHLSCLSFKDTSIAMLSNEDLAVWRNVHLSRTNSPWQGMPHVEHAISLGVANVQHSSWSTILEIKCKAGPCGLDGPGS